MLHHHLSLLLFDDFGHIPKFSTQMDNQGFEFPLSYFTNGNEKSIVDSDKTFII
jgi:hypothetical protein